MSKKMEWTIQTIKWGWDEMITKIENLPYLWALEKKNLTLGANMDSQKGGLTDEPHILIGERTQQTRNIFILTKALTKALRILHAR